MNVPTAFFYGEVKEDIYVIQLIGLKDGSKQVCKLQKAFYMN